MNGRGCKPRPARNIFKILLFFDRLEFIRTNRGKIGVKFLFQGFEVVDTGFRTVKIDHNLI
ncbi:MAG: hypothetical protein DRI57_12240 [Deltaproteobacteria bacterium]|nr:MAG: hypothetical protein DRI57_12240 [Deltaproteobacteria bacterium]